MPAGEPDPRLTEALDLAAAHARDQELPAGEPDPRLTEALDLAAAHARDQELRLLAAERLLADERDARRGDLERVLAALGRQPMPDADVRVLAEQAERLAGELRRRYDNLRRLRWP